MQMPNVSIVSRRFNMFYVCFYCHMFTMIFWIYCFYFYLFIIDLLPRFIYFTHFVHVYHWTFILSPSRVDLDSQKSTDYTVVELAHIEHACRSGDISRIK